MKQRVFVSGLVIALVALLGCVSTVRVHEKSPTEKNAFEAKRLKGIPFYSKTQVFEHQTTWERTWFEVDLVEQPIDAAGTPVGPPATTPKVVPAAALPALRELQNLLVNPKLTSNQLARVRAKFAALPVLTGEPQEVAVSNQVTPRLVVDYDRELYINGVLPWFGSSTLTTKLASDGTLTDATATSDTKVAEGLANLIPLKEFLTAETIPPEPTDDEEMIPLLFKVSLSVARKGWAYVFSATYPTDPRQVGTDCPKIPEPCLWPGCSVNRTGAAPDPSAVARGSLLDSQKLRAARATTGGVGKCKLARLPFDLINGNYTRTPVGAKAAPKKEEGKKITFSGDVELPKDTPSGAKKK